MSLIKIDFRGLRDFNVQFDGGIDGVSPRGLELAFAAVMKRYLELRGHATRERRAAEAKAAEVDTAAEEAATRLAEQEAQVIGRHRAEIREEAEAELREMDENEIEAKLEQIKQEKKDAEIAEILSLQEEQEEKEAIGIAALAANTPEGVIAAVNGGGDTSVEEPPVGDTPTESGETDETETQ